MEGQKTIPIESLHPQQIASIRKNLEEEILLLSQSYNQFKIAVNRYEETKKILTVLADSNTKNQEILIPISTSLYVNGINNKKKLIGKTTDNDNVLIDYGTGYFVERNSKDASSFCDRKIAMIKEHTEKVGVAITQKKQVLEKISIELQKKLMVPPPKK